MRRPYIHMAFASAIALCVSMGGVEWHHFSRVMRLNHAISNAERIGGEAVVTGHSDDDPLMILTAASAQARAGNYDTASRAYNGLMSRKPWDDTAQEAAYELGNMYLREGLSRAPEGPAAFLPLVELAKQRYRDVLRRSPENWDARYNLERALRLAPEDQDLFRQSDRVPTERRQALGPESVAPDLP